MPLRDECGGNQRVRRRQRLRLQGRLQTTPRVDWYCGDGVSVCGGACECAIHCLYGGGRRGVCGGCVGWDGEAGVIEKAAVGGGRGLEKKSGLVAGKVPGGLCGAAEAGSMVRLDGAGRMAPDRWRCTESAVRMLLGVGANGASWMAPAGGAGQAVLCGRSWRLMQGGR